MSKVPRGPTEGQRSLSAGKEEQVVVPSFGEGEDVATPLAAVPRPEPLKFGQRAQGTSRVASASGSTVAKSAAGDKKSRYIRETVNKHSAAHHTLQRLATMDLDAEGSSSSSSSDAEMGEREEEEAEAEVGVWRVTC